MTCRMISNSSLERQGSPTGEARGPIGQDSGRVLTRTLTQAEAEDTRGVYFSGGDPVSSSHRLIIMDLH